MSRFMVRGFRSGLDELVRTCALLSSRGATLHRRLSARSIRLRGTHRRCSLLRGSCSSLGLTGVVDVSRKRFNGARGQLSGLIHRISGYVTLLGTSRRGRSRL